MFPTYVRKGLIIINLMQKGLLIVAIRKWKDYNATFNITSSIYIHTVDQDSPKDSRGNYVQYMYPTLLLQ